MNLIPGTTLHSQNGKLYLESCSLESIAEAEGTPVYVYSRAYLEDQYLAYDRALAEVPHLICYGMKACGNLSILKALGELGAGVDLVSGGELYRAQRAGIPAERMVFSGVGKTEDEIRRAIAAEILMLNVESSEELHWISQIASSENRTAGISIRINPNIDARTHPYISTGLDENKFGIPYEEAVEIYRLAKRLPALEIRGLQSHIGSQITDVSVFGEALDRLVDIYRALIQEGISIRYLDLGGGLGISYRSDSTPGPAEMIDTLRERLRALPLTILLEPGRSIIGNAGLLLTRVLYYKENRQRRFAIVDAGMTELIRPALYEAHHEIVPITTLDREQIQVDVVGPVCESTDVLAKDRLLPMPRRGDIYAILSAGAYGFCMASNYNARLRPPEVLVEGDHYRVIRRRETYEDLVEKELL